MCLPCANYNFALIYRSVLAISLYMYMSPCFSYPLSICLSVAYPLCFAHVFVDAWMSLLRQEDSRAKHSMEGGGGGGLVGNGRNRKKCSNRNQRTLAINNGPKVLGIKQMDNGARHETFWRLAYGDCAEVKRERKKGGTGQKDGPKRPQLQTVQPRKKA